MLVQPHIEKLSYEHQISYVRVDDNFSYNAEVKFDVYRNSMLRLLLFVIIWC